MLPLQSTGYAAGLLTEIGGPIRRMMSSVKPFSAAVMRPLQMAEYHAAVSVSHFPSPMKRYFSSSKSAFLDESSKEHKTHAMISVAPVKTIPTDEDLKASYELAQYNCFPTLRRLFPEQTLFFDRIDLNFSTYFNYQSKKAPDKFLRSSSFAQYIELKEQWSIWKQSVSSPIESVSVERIDKIFEDITLKLRASLS